MAFTYNNVERFAYSWACYIRSDLLYMNSRRPRGIKALCCLGLFVLVQAVGIHDGRNNANIHVHKVCEKEICQT